jgi:hypothetical protein
MALIPSDIVMCPIHGDIEIRNDRRSTDDVLARALQKNVHDVRIRTHLRTYRSIRKCKLFGERDER